ncbi:CHASE3 domain-containing protein [Thauera humireducens]|uniref:histidine kinase n=1 Tax=Thauera humireducens TaxID=1134435 RepID=A0A127K8B4_9RHOO|nr:CHASE3 domain-containing protein [Thauera humireducens]AMO38193.1 histidine kinase [Thauera humireducens]
MSRPSSLLPRTTTLLLLMVLALGFTLGVVWLLSAQRQSATSREALQQLQARSSRIAQLDTLLVNVLDAESGVRGFINSNNPVFLTPYQDGRAVVDKTLAALKAGEWENAAQRSSLDQLALLIEARWKVMTQALEQSALPKTDGPTGGIGKELTDDIRSLILGLRAQTVAQMNATIVASFDRFAEARRTNTVLGLGVLVLLLAIIVLLYRQERLRDRLAALLQSENARLQAEVAARTADLSNLATYLTNTREAEQERIARELHDELGALLTAAKLDAGWIARKLPAEAMAPLRDRFDRLLDTLSQVISIKRRVVADLRPPLLAELGLIEALRSLAQSGMVGENEGRIELELPETLPELPASVSLALFRIAQEALTNVRRHAQAKRVRLSLTVEPQEIVLQVEDDGTGFDPSVQRLNRHGLTGIAHRVQMLAGRLEVASRPGHGTRIEARVPLNAAAA